MNHGFHHIIDFYRCYVEQIEKEISWNYLLRGAPDNAVGRIIRQRIFGISTLRNI